MNTFQGIKAGDRVTFRLRGGSKRTASVNALLIFPTHVVVNHRDNNGTVVNADNYVSHSTPPPAKPADYAPVTEAQTMVRRVTEAEGLTPEEAGELEDILDTEWDARNGSAPVEPSPSTNLASDPPAAPIEEGRGPTMKSIIDQIQARAILWADQLKDGEIVGRDLDGCIVLWNAQFKLAFNSEWEISDFPEEDLTDTAKYRVLQSIRPVVVAVEFCRRVRDSVERPEIMFAIEQKLKDPRYATACPVQDYMDANQVMHSAICEVAGFEVEMVCDEPGKDASQALWNEAWEIARACRYSYYRAARRAGCGF